LATRHQARESVVGLLYAYDLGNTEILKFSEEVLEEKKIRNKQREFALELFNGVISNYDYINDLIKSHLKEHDFDKIGYIERAVLRLAIYELFTSQLDVKIIINEAIELVKRLGNFNSQKFINGVVDAIYKDLKSGKISNQIVLK
jgi:N utilization substance protein B